MKHSIHREFFRAISVLLTVVMLLSVCSISGSTWSEPNQNLIRNYRDVSKTAWYYDSVNWVVSNKLMSNLGNSKKFEPDVTVTRATFCKLCMNFVEALERDTANTGKTGWRDDVWYNTTPVFTDKTDKDGNIVRPADWQPSADERIYTEDGYLYMNGAYPEKYEYYNRENCIAALFTSKDGQTKFSQSYGYYEMRLRPSDAAGFISTFWMTALGSDRLYDPDASPLQSNPFVEMDIMETLPHNKANFFSTLHWTYAATPDYYESEQC